MPRVTIRLPWGEVPGEVGIEVWQDNAIVVPEKYAAASVPVELEVEKLFAPMRHGIQGDNRELGVMLSLADVMPAPNPYRVSSVPLERISGGSRGV
jgi:hypothetical protein